MNEKSFKEVESRIYRYYKNIKKIERLEYKCFVLEKTQEDLRKDIKNTNVTIDPFLNVGIAYSEKVQASSTNLSYAEKEVTKQIEKLINEFKETKKEILKTHAKIREIKKNNAEMQHIVELLATESRMIVELRYKERLNYHQIGNKLYIAKSTVSRNIEKIVQNIYEVLKK